MARRAEKDKMCICTVCRLALAGQAKLLFSLSGLCTSMQVSECLGTLSSHHLVLEVNPPSSTRRPDKGEWYPPPRTLPLPSTSVLPHLPYE
jgi:hypothetical protein